MVCTSVIARQLLKAATANLRPQDLVVRRSIHAFRANFKTLLRLFDLHEDNYNVYSLRRGGATAFFMETGSMDRTMTVGRWECASTARIYIQQATAETSELRMSERQNHLLRTAAKQLIAFGNSQEW